MAFRQRAPRRQYSHVAPDIARQHNDLEEGTAVLGLSWMDGITPHVWLRQPDSQQVGVTAPIGNDVLKSGTNRRLDALPDWRLAIRAGGL